MKRVREVQYTLSISWLKHVEAAKLPKERHAAASLYKVAMYLSQRSANYTR
jgi:hypothetical protein